MVFLHISLLNYIHFTEYRAFLYLIKITRTYAVCFSERFPVFHYFRNLSFNSEKFSTNQKPKTVGVLN